METDEHLAVLFGGHLEVESHRIGLVDERHREEFGGHGVGAACIAHLYLYFFGT